MAWLFLLVCLIGAALTYNVYRPAYAPARRAAVSFFVGWLTIELALHHIAFQLLATVVFAWAGALEAWPGKLGLAVAVVSWVALGWRYWASRQSEEVIERALQDGLGADYRSKILPEVSAQFGGGVAWKEILFPFPIRHAEVERVRDIRYARVAGLNLKLDVYRHRSRPINCPTLLQIHGGAWILGSKNEQGLPLMHHLASRGWVCVSADYRLSPHATFPDHVVDLKRAIGWIREHGREYGANPDFLVVTGGSAGGHLAALVSLTANDPAFQPGFEQVDTSVQGCVPFYGVYDFADRDGIWYHPGLRELLEQKIMKASLDEAPELYEQASPIAQISPDDPPFFVIHGELDTMVPVAEARAFCQKFRRTARSPIVYAEIPHAQHAFEIFPSLRTAFVVQGVERFVSHLYSEYLRTNRTTGDDTAPVTATG
jgi:acetyl esterase/lipase